ncbi:MAG TPA: tRNA (adenosine(37)-N6)-threonylcarbamoyltransferase complex transferase subunit TsaD, partial [Coxiellaceae bacterium]|nr:tRNA (adenosine(37)-N6)-threonylcarbamoyltransferase complex transferase subunit TsaD [Coxiellaceae bacterium]
MRILGIESSCDDTGVAIFVEGQGLKSHLLFNRLAVHASHGGVVPELAARDHIRHLTRLVNQALQEAELDKNELDGIAYTAGPGLIGSLLVGASVARSLAYALKIPSLGVHHLEAHLMAVMLSHPQPTYPFLALLISGGHTMLLEVRGLGDYHLLGESLDDAVGEAFDKTARLLGLDYPGGAALARLAENGRAGRFNLTRPMLNRPGLDFSFSGLKTQVMNLINQQTEPDA